MGAVENFMRRIILLIVFSGLSIGTCFAQTHAAESRAAIEQVMRQQETAWNRGDLEGFMQGYWKSPELTFFSGAEVSHGWTETLERYRKRYQSEGKEMGTLEFSALQIEPMGDGAFVRGSWKLSMKDGKTPHGLFTLIFRKFSEGWRIVHDHSSAG